MPVNIDCVKRQGGRLFCTFIATKLRSSWLAGCRPSLLELQRLDDGKGRAPVVQRDETIVLLRPPRPPSGAGQCSLSDGIAREIAEAQCRRRGCGEVQLHSDCAAYVKARRAFGSTDMISDSVGRADLNLCKQGTCPRDRPGGQIVASGPCSPEVFKGVRRSTDDSLACVHIELLWRHLITTTVTHARASYVSSSRVRLTKRDCHRCLLLLLPAGGRASASR
jgi:hypothetical protein